MHNELDKPAEKSNRGRQSANPKTEAAKTFAAKIFKTHEFGYRRITIERPLRQSYQFSDERIATLRFESGALNSVMQWAYAEFANLPNAIWATLPIVLTMATSAATKKRSVVTSRPISPISKKSKSKTLLDRSTWTNAKTIMLKAKALQAQIGTAQCDDMNGYEDAVAKAAKLAGISLDAKDKAIESAVSWKNQKRKPSSRSLHKTKADPIYGLFEGEGEHAGKTIEYKADGDLRDFENVALDPRRSVNEVNEAYFKKECNRTCPMHG